MYLDALLEQGEGNRRNSEAAHQLLSHESKVIDHFHNSRVVIFEISWLVYFQQKC